MLRIPRLGVAVDIVAGVDTDDLRHAVGLVPGTAWPGRPGRSVLAGHSWAGARPFEHLDALRRGDEIFVEFVPAAPGDDGSRRRFVVEASTVVSPRVGLARGASGDRPELALVTCYPRWTTARLLMVVGQGVDAERGDPASVPLRPHRRTVASP